MNTTAQGVIPERSARMPWTALLALASVALLVVLTELVPAGLLPAMSADLGVDESTMGQAVTAYAAGTAFTVIPLAAATAGLRRRPLLLGTVALFAAANTVTALSSDHLLTLAARGAAGVAAGLAWAMLVGYARSLVPDRLQGRAIAVVLIGIPVALSLGVPAGAFLGQAVGWRTVFLTITAIAVALVVWILAAVPDRPGQPREERVPFARVFALPGLVPLLAVTLLLVTAHTVLYTYIAPVLADAGRGGGVDLVLLVFGAASVAGVWIVGVLIDRRLRALTVGAVLLIGAAALLLALVADLPGAALAAAALWGLGWGGVPTLLQTAVADVGGAAAVTAQSVYVTLWNVAMAGGGAVGGALLARAGAGALPWGVLVLTVPVVLLVLASRKAFPAARS
ncbi:MFS transporter [Nocardiopsis sp. CC223A]|uniref:MFS transporter n=1 Tax=Nocardiopsis sp. CC223A TaxID=3044051 RepID=UPI002795F130|nr:MFS transporter [Nocardiopsis sp. CC223A]